MNEAAVIICLVLFAVLVGSLLPVFYQVVQTLKSVKQFMDTAGPRLEQALEEITEASARLNRIGSTLEGEGQRLKPLMDSAASLGQTLQGLRRSVQSAGTILTALGPALLAGLGAFVARRGSHGDGADKDEPDRRRDIEEPGPEGDRPQGPARRAEEESRDDH
jgi:uncharacterized protein YoxC